jgi:Uma2 family endonuclease
MYQQHPRSAAESLPTMYDLPSEDPEEPGLPDQFHDFQPKLLRETCHPTTYPASKVFIAADLNLYYDSRHPQWHKRPDWYLVLGAAPAEQVEDLRWSYVIWQEGISPFLVIELLSPGTEHEDLGQTHRQPGEQPLKWKVYEWILRIPFYVVYDRFEQQLQIFGLEQGRYRSLELTEPRYWFEELGLGLGLWSGRYQGIQGQWLRWYDAAGAWIPTHANRATAAQVLAAQAQALREAIPRLKALGLGAEQIAEALGLPMVSDRPEVIGEVEHN